MLRTPCCQGLRSVLGWATNSTGCEVWQKKVNLQIPKRHNRIRRVEPGSLLQLCPAKLGRQPSQDQCWKWVSGSSRSPGRAACLAWWASGAFPAARTRSRTRHVCISFRLRGLCLPGVIKQFQPFLNWKQSGKMNTSQMLSPNENKEKGRGLAGTFSELIPEELCL